MFNYNWRFKCFSRRLTNTSLFSLTHTATVILDISFRKTILLGLRSGLNTKCKRKTVFTFKLSGSDWTFGKICREFYINNLPLKYRLSDPVQCYGFQNFKSGGVERFRRRYVLKIVKARTSNCQSRLF